MQYFGLNVFVSTWGEVQAPSLSMVNAGTLPMEPPTQALGISPHLDLLTRLCYDES